jgi:Mg-chelatase subunit ChlD
LLRLLLALLAAGCCLVPARTQAGEPPEGVPPRSEPLPREPLRLRSELPDETRLRIDIEVPPEGALIRDSACGVFVAGRALALRGEAHQFDVVIVIDTSRSTIEPAGADIDGDGLVGRAELAPVGSTFEVRCSDPGDAILAAEVAAARALLRSLDPRSTRVALVGFAGALPDEGRGLFRRPPAETLEPLTADFARVERALDALAAHEPDGSTHMAAGIERALGELLGLPGARSEPRGRSEKIVFFFTDGRPTLPYGPAREADNAREVLLAADRAREAQIRLHSFAIGPEALDGPVAAVEMAERTGGTFTPVRHPADLIEVVGETSFANLEEVALRSLTTGAPAEHFRRTADGAWAGFVRGPAGANRIEVRARASDGVEAVRELEVRLGPEGTPPTVPPDLVVAHNRLLDECLRTLKDLNLQAERVRAEQVRRALLEEIERERARARERSAEQRKQLELDLDEEEEPRTPPP